MRQLINHFYGQSVIIARVILAICVCAVLNSALSASEKAGREIAVSTVESIESAYKFGKITQAQKALLNAQYFRNYSALPAEYKSSDQSDLPMRCGTEVMRELHQVQSELSGSDAQLAAAMMARPNQDVSYVSPSGFFRIHFDTIGVEAPPMADTNSSGVSDFIEKAAFALDSAWTHYHSTLGYALPPSDGVAGGDNKYDVYIVSLFGYGSTTFESQGPQPWNDFISYILVDNNFTGLPANSDPEGNVIGALKVTCAHEYYHAVQLAYDGGDDIWIYESSATWSEDVVFPETHDNYNYLPYFYDYPDTFLTAAGGLHQYGAYVWPTFLAEQFGESLMKTVWEKSINLTGLISFDSALAPYATTVSKQFQDFVTWNFFTGDRHDGAYPFGGDFPGVTYDGALPTIPFTGAGPFKAPDGVACNYKTLTTVGGPPGLLKLEIVGSTQVSWGYNVYLKDSLGNYEISQQTAPASGKQTFVKFKYTDYDTIFVAPAVISKFHNNNLYTLNSIVAPIGDVNGSNSLNIADATYTIAYIFSGGPAPQFHLLMGDVDCNERINIADVSYIISHIFVGGPAPCTGE